MLANKITLNDKVLIDLTEDTAVEADVLEGKTFHKADGSIAVGTAKLGGSGNADLLYDNDKAKEQTEINLPNVETLLMNAFYNRNDIYATSIVAPKLKNIGIMAFASCTNLALTALPENMSGYIANQAFQYCTNLKITHIPAGVTELRGYCFQGCTGLTSITFKGKPTSIAYNAFRDCTNLKEIKVPWADGEIAEAPWGATNAKVTYGYTEG